MVELYQMQGLDPVTKYPDLHSEDTLKDIWEENYRVFSSEIQKNGKVLIQVNQKNKASLLKLCENLLKFFYNSKCFDLGVNKYAEQVDILMNKMNECLNLFQVWTYNIQDTIQKMKLKMFENEEKLEKLLNEEKEFNEPVLIETFTDLGDFASSLALKAGFNKKKAGFEKNLEFAKVYLEKLEICKVQLQRDYDIILQSALQKTSFIRSQMNIAREIQQELSSISSIKDFMSSPYLQTKVINFISKVPSLSALILEVQFKLSEFRFNYLSKTDAKDDLYSNLINLYENQAVYETVLPIFEADKEALKEKEAILREKVLEYSSTWILKHFQKNLCKIIENISHVINFFDSIQLIKKREYCKGVSEIKLSAFIPNIKPLTLENYKTQFIFTNDQKIILNSILKLFSNLSKVFYSCQSLRIDDPLLIKWNRNVLESVDAKVSDFELKNHSAEYLKLFEKVKMIEKTIENLNESLKQVQLVTVKGMTSSPIVKSVLENSFLNVKNDYYCSRQGSHGLVDISLVSPKFLRMRNEKSLQFPRHQDFKVLRKQQLDLLENIKNVQKKIDEKEVILQEIDMEYTRIEYRLSQRFDLNDINAGQLELIYSTLISQTELNSLAISKEHLDCLIGGIFARLSFRKSKMLKKAKKSNERNMITLAQFYENLENCIKGLECAKGMKFQQFSQDFFGFQRIDCRIMLNSIVSEELLGSYLNDFDTPQSIVFERVDENIQKSLFEVCRNIATVLLMEKKEFHSNKEIERNVNEFRRIFNQVTQEFK